MFSTFPKTHLKFSVSYILSSADAFQIGAVYNFVVWLRVKKNVHHFSHIQFAMGVDRSVAFAAPIKSVDEVLRKCFKKRGEIHAKKHPGMHKIPSFFQKFSGTISSSSTLPHQSK